jgi:hypothetical protein
MIFIRKRIAVKVSQPSCPATRALFLGVGLAHVAKARSAAGGRRPERVVGAEYRVR